MTSFFTNRFNIIIMMIIAVVIGYGSSGSHPTTGGGGYTGAPGDGLCTQCHGGSNSTFAGGVTIDGLPATIIAGDNYTLTVNISSSNGNAVKAGFQMLVLNGSNQNAGILSNPSTFTSLKPLGSGKVYFGHEPAQDFAGQTTMSYTVDWEAPSTIGSNPVIKFYASTMLANGNGANTGDKMFLYSQQIPISLGNGPLMAMITDVSDISCFGEIDGSATVNATDGMPPYSYLWSNGVTTATTTTLGKGTATVTVTDSNSDTATASTTIIEPPVLFMTIDGNATNPCPEVLIAELSAYVMGGSPPYAYLWSNGATTQQIFNLPAGIYSCTVTDDNGCTVEYTSMAYSDPGVTVNLLLLSDISCNGEENGEIGISGSGGQNNLYTYNWSNGVTTSFIDELAVGTYTVTVTASISGCSAVATYEISEPTVIELNGSNVNQVSCHDSGDGSISIAPSGGDGNFTHLWSTGSTEQTIINLSSGTYSVTVTDERGCTATQSFMIEAPDSIALNVVSSMNASCNGAMNGSLLLSASGGTPPFEYAWSNGNNTNFLSEVAAGIYTVTVTDSKNCLKTASYTVGTNSSFMIGTPTVTDIICGGDSTGTITLPAVIGWTYNWTNGRTGAILDSLKARTYTVVATDEFNCQSQPLSITVKENPRLKSSLIAADTLLCAGEENGFLDTKLSGGLGKLKFRWNTGDTIDLRLENLIAGKYYNRVVDSLGCVDTFRYEVIAVPIINVDSVFASSPSCFGKSNGQLSLALSGGYEDYKYKWSNNSTADTLRSIKAGTYGVTITDGNNCSIIDTFTVTQPDSISSTALVVNESIAGAVDGKMEINVMGGTAPYVIQWDSGQTSFSLDSLNPGVYRYLLTDANGCTENGLAVVGGGECSFTFDYTKVDPTCFNSFDGAINLNLPSDTSNYKIQLFKADNPSNSSLNMLDAGTYTVIVTDSLNCVFAQEDIILMSDNSAIVLDSIAIVKPKGSAGKEGRIEVYISGGVAPFNYKWSKNGDVLGTNSFIDGLGIGIYRLEVTDAAGCKLLIKDIQLEATSAVEDLLVNQLMLYPNPVSQVIYIKADNAQVIESFQLFDIRGQALSSKLKVLASEVQIELNTIGDVPNGVYLVKLEVNDEILIKKIIVLRD